MDNGLLRAPMSAPPEVGEQWFQRPNMDPGDGFHVLYGRSGDLRWLRQQQHGKLHGVQLRFDTSGELCPAECSVYEHGKCVELWQMSLLPQGHVERALRDLIIPVKKSLGVALCLGERRLCAELQVNIDAPHPAAL